MLSLFPELLDWSFFVPFFFRVFIGCYVLIAGYQFIKKHHNTDQLSWGIFGGLLFVLGIILVVGIYTQVAGAIIFTVSMLAVYTKKHFPQYVPESIPFYMLFGLTALSLVFLGAGPYAFDLPL